MDDAMVSGLVDLAARMEAAVALLEGAVTRMYSAAERGAAVAASAEESVGRIVATVESAREAELERKLVAAEARIAELTVSAAGAAAGRKTLSAGMTAMLSKQGVAGSQLEGMEAGAMDAALGSLSIEQRIAVKSELMRAGLLR